jgi:hypothetical protein
MKAYKLTDKNGITKNNTQWGPNVTHTASGTNRNLCSNGWIHFSKDPVLAVLLNPIHANFSSPKLWECETYGEELHAPLESGCKTLTTIKEIPLPNVTNIQRIAFAILCAKEVYKKSNWNTWADKWLSAKDRTHAATYATYDAVYAVTYAAAYAAAAYAVATYDATSYDAAAYAAACATYAVDAACDINFIELAHKALTYK